MKAVTFSNVTEVRLSFWVKTKQNTNTPVYIDKGINNSVNNIMSISIDLGTLPCKKFNVTLIIKILQKALNQHTKNNTFSIRQNIAQVQHCRSVDTTYSNDQQRYIADPLVSWVSVIVSFASIEEAKEFQQITAQSPIAKVLYDTGRKKRYGTLISTLNYGEDTILMTSEQAVAQKNISGLKKSASGMMSNIGSKIISSLIEPS